MTRLTWGLLSFALGAQACLSPPRLAAQTLDSTRSYASTVSRVDSVVRWYTTTVQLPGRVDTIFRDSTAPVTPPVPLPAPCTLTCPPAVVALGLPFGPFSLWSTYTTVKSGPGPFTASENYTDPAGIVAQIAAARAMKQKLVLAMTGGPHSLYLTNGVFDMAKWKARMNTYNTTAIKAAVAAGVADGTILGNSVMDEPEVTGAGDGNTWGPAGSVTKPMVNSMALYVKGLFPTLPVGVDHGPGYYAFRPTERYTALDYVMTSYLWWITTGDVMTWRSKVLTQAQLDGVAIVFALNIRSGGIHNWTTKTCPIPLTGGPGSYVPTCQMTAQQIRDWGLALGPRGCALLLWEYNATMMAKAENQAAFKDISTALATQPAKSCRRL